MKLNNDDKEIINSILEIVREYRINHKWNDNQIALVNFDYLFNKILKDKIKIDFCNKFLSINPLDHGFKGIYYGREEAKKVKKISNQKLNNGVKLQTQYVLSDVYKMIKKMNHFMKKELGVNIIIQSGYRSPAYQLIVFFWHLRDSGYDFDIVIKKVALPFYSEHGSVSAGAVDLISSDADNLFESTKFKATKEYKWLKENGQFFGFYESYFKNNEMGVMHEPWHWHFES